MKLLEKFKKHLDLSQHSLMDEEISKKLLQLKSDTEQSSDIETKKGKK